MELAFRAIKDWAGWTTDQFEIGTFHEEGTRYAFGIFGLYDGCGDDLFLQCNQVYCGETLYNPICLSVAVYALRFNLCSGWFPFVMHNTHLVPLISISLNRLHFRNFVNPDAALEYSRAFPESAGYSWQKVRRLGVPYSVVSNIESLFWRNGENVALREWPWQRVRAIIENPLIPLD